MCPYIIDKYKDTKYKYSITSVAHPINEFLPASVHMSSYKSLGLSLSLNRSDIPPVRSTKEVVTKPPTNC